MALTTPKFKGKGDGKQDDVMSVLRAVPGGKAMQSQASKGLSSNTGSAPPGDMPTPPRSMYSAEVGLGVIGDQRHPLVTSGGKPTGQTTGDLHANPESSGKGALAKGKDILGSPGKHNPIKTGAGKGKKIVVTYGPGGVGGPAV